MNLNGSNFLSLKCRVLAGTVYSCPRGRLHRENQGCHLSHSFSFKGNFPGFSFSKEIFWIFSLKGNFLDFLSQRKFSGFSLSKEIFWIFSLKENFPKFSFSKDIFWIFSLKRNFLDFLSQRKLSKFFCLKGNFPNFSLSKEIFQVFLSQRKISRFSLSKEIFRLNFKKSPACFIAGLRQAWRAAKISHTLGLTRLLCRDY